MSEAHRDLIGRIGLVVDPIAHVPQQRSEVGGDIPPIDAYIPLRLAELAGPTPLIAVHALVQRADKLLREHFVLCARVEGLSVSFVDINWLSFVQLVTER